MSALKHLKIGLYCLILLILGGWGWSIVFNWQVNRTLEANSQVLSWRDVDTHAFSGQATLHDVEARNSTLPLRARLVEVNGLFDGTPDTLSLKKLSTRLAGAPNSLITAESFTASPSPHSQGLYDFTLEQLQLPASIIEESFQQPNFTQYSPLPALHISGKGQLTWDPQQGLRDIRDLALTLEDVADVSIERHSDFLILHLRNQGLGTLIHNQAPGFTGLLVRQASRFLARQLGSIDEHSLTAMLLAFLEPKGSLSLRLNHPPSLSLQKSIEHAFQTKAVQFNPGT